MSAIDEQGLQIRLREPAAEPAGAIVLNHGRGADQDDLYGLFESLDPERRLLGVATGAPIVGLPPGGRHWYVVERVGHPDPETFARSLRTLNGRLDAILAERSIPWSRTVVGGFSQGAVMAYATALGEARPRPAAILGLSGFVPEAEGWRPELSGLERTDVFIHHGLDDPIIGVQFGRAARDLLVGAGLDPLYVETNAGHALPAEILPELRSFVAGALGLDSGVSS